MARRLSIASGIITALAAAFALLLALSVPALAHHKDGHEGGPSKSEATDSSGSETDDDDNMHPSGKDRETNDGSTDDEQGNSGSDPDDDGRGPDRSNGGADKTGGSGGVDQDDQDGNNGCGNDDDFEDDNEGWCGKKPKPEKQESNDEVDGEVITDEGTEDEVEGDIAVAEEPALPAPDVLGLRVRGDRELAVAPAVRGARVRGGVLPFTGGDVLGFVFLALGLVAAGYLMLRSRRRV